MDSAGMGEAVESNFDISMLQSDFLPKREARDTVTTTQNDDFDDSIDDEVSHVLPSPIRAQSSVAGDPSKSSIVTNLPAFGSPLSPSDSGLPIAVSTPAYLFTSRFKGSSPGRSLVYSLAEKSQASQGGFASLGSEILASASAPFSKSPLTSPVGSPGQASHISDESRRGGEESIESSRNDEERLAKLTSTTSAKSPQHSFLPSFLLPRAEDTRAKNQLTSPSQSPTPKRAGTSASERVFAGLRSLSPVRLSRSPVPNVDVEEKDTRFEKDGENEKSEKNEGNEKALGSAFEPVSRNLRPPTTTSDTPLEVKSNSSAPRTQSKSPHTKTVRQISPRKLLRDLSRVMSSPSPDSCSRLSSSDVEKNNDMKMPKITATNDGQNEEQKEKVNGHARERVLSGIELLNRDIMWTKVELEEMMRTFKDVSAKISDEKTDENVARQSANEEPEKSVVEKIVTKHEAKKSTEELWNLDAKIYNKVEKTTRVVMWILMLFVIVRILSTVYDEYIDTSYIGPEIALGRGRVYDY
ncbi:uncharacterized protein V2V93DRAFT_376151 [Kockiozyma suomiensis]|uniref:uncharacterized protein n=1 Tax=Kockiozyma suomiensis TaxID=1337062 RepID=UPI0033430BF3